MLGAWPIASEATRAAVIARRGRRARGTRHRDPSPCQETRASCLFVMVIPLHPGPIPPTGTEDERRSGCSHTRRQPVRSAGTTRDEAIHGYWYSWGVTPHSPGRSAPVRLRTIIQANVYAQPMLAQRTSALSAIMLNSGSSLPASPARACRTLTLNLRLL